MSNQEKYSTYIGNILIEDLRADPVFVRDEYADALYSLWENNPDIRLPSITALSLGNAILKKEGGKNQNNYLLVKMTLAIAYFLLARKLDRPDLPGLSYICYTSGLRNLQLVLLATENLEEEKEQCLDGTTSATGSGRFIAECYKRLLNGWKGPPELPRPKNTEEAMLRVLEDNEFHCLAILLPLYTLSSVKGNGTEMIGYSYAILSRISKDFEGFAGTDQDKEDNICRYFTVTELKKIYWDYLAIFRNGLQELGLLRPVLKEEYNRFFTSFHDTMRKLKQQYLREKQTSQAIKSEHDIEPAAEEKEPAEQEKEPVEEEEKPVEEEEKPVEEGEEPVDGQEPVDWEEPVDGEEPGEEAEEEPVDWKTETFQKDPTTVLEEMLAHETDKDKTLENLSGDNFTESAVDYESSEEAEDGELFENQDVENMDGKKEVEKEDITKKDLENQEVENKELGNQVGNEFGNEVGNERVESVVEAKPVAKTVPVKTVANASPVKILPVVKVKSVPVTVPVTVPATAPIAAPIAAPVSVPVKTPVKTPPLAPVNSVETKKPLISPVKKVSKKLPGKFPITIPRVSDTGKRVPTTLDDFFPQELPSRLDGKENLKKKVSIHPKIHPSQNVVPIEERKKIAVSIKPLS